MAFINKCTTMRRCAIPRESCMVFLMNGKGEK